MRVLPVESMGRIPVGTTQEMCDEVLSRLPECDYVIKAAAPADYRVAQAVDRKLKASELQLHLVKNPDIAAQVGRNKGKAKLVVFSAETENLEENAAAKRLKKNADMVVANDVTAPGAGFDVDTNVAVLITADKTERLQCMQKSALAEVILDRLAQL